ncbi:MAG: retropepsin-like aspartic protease [Candidatus Dormibacterales bacterium]
MTYLPLEIDTDPMEPEAGEVFVQGSVGDRGYRFLLDTGAAITRLVADDYISSFASVDYARSSGVFAASTDELITVPSIKLGPLSRTCVTVARAPGGGRVTTNLVGMDILKDVRLHFDFRRCRLGIDPPADVALGATFHDMSMDSRFHPYFALELGSAAAAGVWDSGASLTVVDSVFVERHPQHSRAEGHC